MPWELGFMDAEKSRVAICPIVNNPLEDEYHGQEYLGLYPYVDIANSEQSGKKKLWIHESKAKITSFEDDIAREYRGIINKIPTKAILGEELSDKEFDNALDDLFSYIDLSNEEIFLRQQKRVRKKTWFCWCEGIEMNLEKPAYKKAWTIIKASDTEIFSELRRLEKSDFKDDPKNWK